MADLTVAVKLVGEDRLTGPVKAASSALGGLTAAAKAPVSAIGGLADGLGKFGLAGLGISTVTGAVGGLADAVGFGLANQMEQATASFNAFTKDSAKSAEIIEQVRIEAAKTPFTFQEMTTAAAGLLPVTKASGESLQNLLKDAEVLSASNPMQGFEGAVFSLREAVTGDFTSIIERFNLSRSTINKLKEEGVPNIEIVRKAMLEMGFDSDLVSAKAETLEGRWSTFQDTIDNLKMRLAQPIFEAAKEGLMGLGGVLEDALPLLESVADQLAGGFRQAVGVFKSAMTAGQALVTAFTRDTGAMGIVLDKIREIFGDTIADALQPFIQWFMDAIPEIKSFVSILQGRFEILAEIVQKVFGGDIAGALDLFQGDLKDNTDQLVLTLSEWGKAFLAWLGPLIPPLLQQLADLVGAATRWMLDVGLPALIKQLGEWASAFVDWVGPQIRPLLTELGELLGALGRWLENPALPAIIDQLLKWGQAFIEWVAPLIPPLLLELGKLLLEVTGWLITTALPLIVGKLAEWGLAFVSWIATDVLPNLPPALNAIQDAIAAWMRDEALPWIGRELVKLGTAMVDAIGAGFSGLGAALKATWEAVEFTAGPVRFTGRNGFEWVGPSLTLPIPTLGGGGGSTAGGGGGGGFSGGGGTSDLREAARLAARQFGIPEDVFLRQIQQESGFNPNAMSPAGARGIAQFIPSTGAGVASQLGVSTEQFWASAELQLRGAALHMRDLLNMFGGDMQKALAAYNAGPGAVQRYGGVPPYAETQQYLRAILGGAEGPRGTPEILPLLQGFQGPQQASGITEALSLAVSDLASSAQPIDPQIWWDMMRAMGLDEDTIATICGPVVAAGILQGMGIAEATIPEVVKRTKGMQGVIADLFGYGEVEHPVFTPGEGTGWGPGVASMLAEFGVGSHIKRVDEGGAEAAIEALRKGLSVGVITQSVPFNRINPFEDDTGDPWSDLSQPAPGQEGVGGRSHAYRIRAYNEETGQFDFGGTAYGDRDTGEQFQTLSEMIQRMAGRGERIEFVIPDIESVTQALGPYVEAITQADATTVQALGNSIPASFVITDQAVEEFADRFGISWDHSRAVLERAIHGSTDTLTDFADGTLPTVMNGYNLLDEASRFATEHMAAGVTTLAEQNPLWELIKGNAEAVGQSLQEYLAGTGVDSIDLTKGSIETLRAASGLNFDQLQEMTKETGMDLREWLVTVGVPAAKELSDSLGDTELAAKDMAKATDTIEEPTNDATRAFGGLGDKLGDVAKNQATQISFVLQELRDALYGEGKFSGAGLTAGIRDFISALNDIPRDIEVNIRTVGGVMAGGSQFRMDTEGGGGGGGPDLSTYAGRQQFREENPGFIVEGNAEEGYRAVSLQHGGIVMKDTLAQLHAPEAVIPLRGNGLFDEKRLAAAIATELRLNPPRVAIEDIRSALLRIGQRNGGIVGLA